VTESNAVTALFIFGFVVVVAIGPIIGLKYKSADLGNFIQILGVFMIVASFIWGSVVPA